MTQTNKVEHPRKMIDVRPKLNNTTGRVKRAKAGECITIYSMGE